MGRGNPVLRAGAALLVALAVPSAGEAAEFGLHKFDIGGKVLSARAIDVNADGRLDLVLIVERRPEGGAAQHDLVLLTTPKTANGLAYYGKQDVVRLPCDGEQAGYRAYAGAVALGRFGTKAHGETLLRFLGPDGDVDFTPAGVQLPMDDDTGTARGKRRDIRSILSRSAGTPLVFWDAVADFGDGAGDRCWFPLEEGGVWGGPPVTVKDEGQRTDAATFIRKSTVPTLRAVDVDGDGKKDLVGLDGADLVVWRFNHGLFERAAKGALPFLVPDPARPPEEIRTPRISLADVDADGKVDLLVTLVQGRADRPGGLRTSLYHYAGPFFDDKGTLVEPRVRLDTESVALHPRFVDLDGDGKLDYVCDSIRGTLLDIVPRALGIREPEITYTAFRFLPAKGTFESEPYATVVRVYPGSEARGNTLGRTGFFEGDFDGDGAKDLLDLGTLKSIAILAGTKGEGAFKTPLLAPVALGAGETLSADALIADLDGDGRADAVTWSGTSLYLVMSKKAP
jgi:hypothetical protein